MLDLVASLVDKSLLRPVARPNSGPGSRFEMLETIREYGLEQLAESGEETRSATPTSLTFCLWPRRQSRELWTDRTMPGWTG